MKVRFIIDRFCWIVGLLSLLCGLSAASANPGQEDWKTLETPHFLIHFDAEHKVLAQRLAAIAENVYSLTTSWLQWQPRDKTEVVLDDSLDLSNGSATPLPFNRSTIYLQAPDSGELISNEPWLEQVFTHEFIHIVHMDQATRFPGGLRKIFGRILFSFPQIFSPKWVVEGLAVYGETDQEKGFGRGQSAFYEAMMRTEVMSGVRSLTELSYHGYQGTNWPRGQVYLYGYYFFEFIESTYGRDKIIAYINNWNNNIVPWRMDARAQQVFGVTGKALWSQFSAWLHEKFDPQIELLAARQQATSVITSAPDNVVSNPVWLDNGDFYYYEDDGSSPARIVRLNAEGEQTIDEVDGFLMFDVNQSGDILLSRLEICDEDYLYADLYLWNQEDKDWDRLTHCGRYTRAVWSRDGQQIAVVRKGDGTASLELLDRQRLVENRSLLGSRFELENPATDFELLSNLAIGDTIGQLDWSPDGRFLVATVKRQQSGWNLERFDLGQRRWQTLTQDAQIQRVPHLSRDGRSVYYVADSLLDAETQTHQLAVMSLDLDTLSSTRLSISPTATLEFAVSPDERRIRRVDYTAEGKQILEQALSPAGQRPVLAEDTESSLRPADRAEQTAVVSAGNEMLVKAIPTKENAAQEQEDVSQVQAFVNSDAYFPEQYDQLKNYNPLLSMRPRAWWIWLTSDSIDNTSAQLIVDGADARNHHFWQAAPSVFFDKETLGGSLSYIYKNRFALIATRDVETVQDEDEEKDRPSIWDLEERLQAIYIQPFSSLSQRLYFSLGLATESIERRVQRDDNSIARSSRRDNLAGLSVTWDTTQRFLYSISPESGRTLKFNGEQYGVIEEGTFDGLMTYLDWREYLSLGQSHVLALRWVEGRAEDDTEGFRLGGSSDDFATVAGAIGFGRNEFMLRGYDDNIDELAGQRLRLGSVEWRIPLFEHYDGFFIPPLGVGRGSMAVFVDGGATWDDDEDPDYLYGAGVEFSPQLLIGYDNLSLNTSFGMAYGFDQALGDVQFYFRLGLLL